MSKQKWYWKKIRESKVVPSVRDMIRDIREKITCTTLVGGGVAAELSMQLGMPVNHKVMRRLHCLE